MTDSDPEDLPDHAVVVRGGIMTPANLMGGVSEHGAHPGIYGMSVQAAVGATIEELAMAGRIRSASVGTTTAGAVRRAGYALTKTVGAGFHWTLVVPREFDVQAAAKLATAFTQESNPWTDRRRSR